MSLSKDLVAKFVKITNDSTKPKTEKTLYGAITEYAGEKYVKLDGSDTLTPVSSMDSTVGLTGIKEGDRVMVMIKNHTAVITGNISSPSVNEKDLNDATGGVPDEITRLEKLVADKATIGELHAVAGRVNTLETDFLTVQGTLNAQSATINEIKSAHVTITNTLTAHKAVIDTLDTTYLKTGTAKITYASIEKLDALTGNFNSLNSAYATFSQTTTERLTSAEATIRELNVADGRISDLESDVADINTLIFGSASGTTIQTSFANSVIAQLGNAQIKSAMIESISADKITAGDIITNNVRVKSEDGSLIISDETMQISDGTRVRVQIGKDAANDYSINIWDANGNLMFSKGGITDSAIKEAIIRNDMVSETANISASKLDIDSLFEEINGSTKTIKSTRVYLDENKQTLDVAFKSLSSTVTAQGQTITSQGTTISAIQGKISSKVWQQDIDTAKSEMSTQYSALSQTIDGMSTTISSHSSSLTAVSNKTTSLETDLSGFKTTVSSTYATKSALDTTNSDVSGLTTRMTAAETNITQLSNKITANVTETTNLGTRMTTVEQTASGLTTRLDDMRIGGRNLLRNSRLVQLFSNNSNVYPTSCTLTTENGVTFYRVKRINTETYPNTTLSVYSTIPKTSFEYGEMTGKQVTLSFKARASHEITATFMDYTYGGDAVVDFGKKGETITTEWKTYHVVIDSFPDMTNRTGVRWNPYSMVLPSDILADFYIDVCDYKFELGNQPTDWSPSPEDVSDDILAASKTATNYMSFSGAGLVIGDMTKSSLGKNVLIDSDSVDIRNGSTVLASFGASTITLGQNSADSVINLCDGAGTIRALTSGASTSYPAYDSIEIASQEINTSSQRFVTDVTNSYGVTTTPTIQNDAQIYMLSNKNDAGSFARMEAMCTTTSSGAEMSAGASAIVYNTYSKTYMQIYAHDSTDTLNRSNWINVYPHKTTFNQPLYRYITGTEYAVFDESMDTGWINVTSLGSDFVVYSSDATSKVQYRRRGKIVEIRGAVKPTSSIPGSATNYTIFTLPSGYRPSGQVSVLSQGSGSFNWLLSITSSGVVRFSRYSNGSEYVDTSTSSWLPISAIFLID